MGKDAKIILPKDLQEKMLKFFIQTSIPRQKSQKEMPPIYQKIDRE